MTSNLKILAIDDHPLYMQGMSDCFRHLPMVAKVDTCTSCDEMRQKLKEDEPHLVFLELNLGSSRHDGFSICREITGRYKNIFVAVLSRHNSPHLIEEARKCGARAFFDKSNCSETLHEFLHHFSRGEILHYYIKVASDIKKPHGHFQKDAFELKYLLTRREREVMKLIVEGKEPDEIQAEMNIAYETFRYHHNNLLEKLRLKNDVQLTRFALEHKLTDEDFSVTYRPVPARIKLSKSFNKNL